MAAAAGLKIKCIAIQGPQTRSEDNLSQLIYKSLTDACVPDE